MRVDPCSCFPSLSGTQSVETLHTDGGKQTYCTDNTCDINTEVTPCFSVILWWAVKGQEGGLGGGWRSLEDLGKREGRLSPSWWKCSKHKTKQSGKIMIWWILNGGIGNGNEQKVGNLLY